MTSLKTKKKARDIKPAYLNHANAMAYVGMKRTSFSEARTRHGLRVYSYGTKKLFYKVEDLDAMMQGFILKKIN